MDFDEMDFDEMDFDEMETDSMEDIWSYYDYDQEMDSFFSRKEENKKPDGCDASKKAAPEKNCPQPQKVNPGCPQGKQPRSISCPEKSKPSCSRSGNAAEVTRAACGEKPACPKKVKRESCVKRDPCPKKKRRKKASCGVEKRQSCPRKKQKLPRSGNPFIIFFLKMLQSSRKQACEVAREAGKKWCCMSRSQKKKYEQMACMERRRRCKKQQQEARKKRKCR